MEALKKGIKPQEGMKIFNRILNISQPHVLVSTSDLQRRITEQVDQWQVSEENISEKETASETFYARPGLSTEYIAPRTEMEKTIAEIWQKLFGIEKIGIHDNFFELGGHSLLATQLLNKLRKVYPKAEISLQAFFENASIAGVVKLIQKSYPQKEQDNLLQKFLNQPSPREKRIFVQGYLQNKLTELLRLESGRVSTKTNLVPLGLKKIMPDLIWELKRDFNLRVYPFEILKNSTFEKLTEFVCAEVDRLNHLDKIYGSMTAPALEWEPVKVPVRTSNKSLKKNESMIFIFSAPRSGSTLLRLMLSRHPSLFCPPELGLLTFDSVQAWFDNQLKTFSKEVVLHNLKICTGLDHESCQKLLTKTSSKSGSIQDFYKLIQDYAGTRTLVDKTPGYAMDINTLMKAEQFFENPKYIYLVRHPYSVIESFVRNRFEKLLCEEEVDPYWFAEKVWLTCNYNIQLFSQNIDVNRFYKVTYETLVSQPEKVLRGLCEFLQIDFDERLLQPYEGDQMVAGIGDPDVFQHDKIDANLGEKWKTIRLPRMLSDITLKLATELGYQLPSEKNVVKKETKPLDSDQAQKLLETLDELSDEEVESLLSQMLTNEGNETV
ncbi:MAG: hypothetical protein D6813_00460 [Calditrichaeota bacterium]|nr:MAG: hypothetical protein D6813_00460 [Calditrichota bacterium]